MLKLGDFLFSEEKKEIDDYRKKQEEMRESELEDRLRAEKVATAAQAAKPKAKSSQSKLLMGAVKRSNSRKESGKEEFDKFGPTSHSILLIRANLE
jgi:hypothetical protein